MFGSRINYLSPLLGERYVFHTDKWVVKTVSGEDTEFYAVIETIGHPPSLQTVFHNEV